MPTTYDADRGDEMHRRKTRPFIHLALIIVLILLICAFLCYLVISAVGIQPAL